MITKEQIKAEIDHIKPEHLPILYRMIKALEIPIDEEVGTVKNKPEWDSFINQTYGCLSDAPIKRGKQGEYEVREEM